MLFPQIKITSWCVRDSIDVSNPLK